MGSHTGATWWGPSVRGQGWGQRCRSINLEMYLQFSTTTKFSERVRGEATLFCRSASVRLSSPWYRCKWQMWLRLLPTAVSFIPHTVSKELETINRSTANLNCVTMWEYRNRPIIRMLL